MSYDPKIAHMFSLHEMTDEQKETCRVVREKFRSVAELLDDTCPNSREKSIAMTHLDEASMMAVASIARQNAIKEE